MLTLGGTVQYDIPVMIAQVYSLEEILEQLAELERQEVIGAFDKQTIIEISNDVIKEISKKYENVQKGIGDII